MYFIMKKEQIVEIVKKAEQEGKIAFKKSYLLVGVGVILAAIAGCHFYGRNAGGYQVPAVNAEVFEAVEENINNPKTYVALIEAINSVDVVAKVSGSLDKVNFKEGSFVKKDEPLFVIDKQTYQANYNLAVAQLESAKAQLTRTERDYKRQQQLSSKNIASKATFDAAESAYLQAKAAVSQAEAQLELARIDLDNTEVKAYIDGYIGKTKVTVGNYVVASAEPLARVVQMNPIRVAFSVTDKEYLKLKNASKENMDNLVMNLELANGQVLHEKLDTVFANNEVSQGTATVAVYADIKNDEGLLKPGAYVRISVTSALEEKGIVVPEKAIVQGNEASFVYVVKDNLASMKKVSLGEAFDGKQVVLDGINAGDKVMISGLSNRMLRDGAAINVLNAN
jgi:membrane fusion protein (multidrug efflux system)